MGRPSAGRSTANQAMTRTAIARAPTTGKDDAIVAGHRQERPADRHPDGATEQLGGQVDTARLAVLRRRDGRHDRARPATRGSTACGFSPSSARSGE